MERPENLLDQESLDIIWRALKRGNTVEVKKERDKIVIVELERHARRKTVIIG